MTRKPATGIDDLPKVPKGHVDIDGEILPLSKEYYLMQGGSCSRIPMKSNGTSTEWPYDTAKMKRCDKAGTHPHIWVRPRRTIRKKRKATA